MKIYNYPEYNKEYNRRYSTSVKGKAVQMWHHLSDRVKTNKSYKNKNIRVLMTQKEFIGWAVPELEKWIVTKQISDATIDRKDNFGHYEISNIQLLGIQENTLKRENIKNPTAPEGKAWCGKCTKYLPISEFYKRSSNIYTGYLSVM